MLLESDQILVSASLQLNTKSTLESQLSEFQRSKTLEERGFKSTPEIIPPCFRVIMFDCRLFIAPFSCEVSEDPSRYFSVWNRRFEVRYRFFPAILIEFPNDDCSD